MHQPALAGDPHDSSRIARAGLVAVVAAVVTIYAPDLGRGFIKDDFAWLLDSRIQSLSDVLRIFVTHNGFYRPVVALTFGLSQLVFGLHPIWYGLTNLILVLAIVLAIVRLSTSLGIGIGAGVVAAGIWALNFHGINMAVLWISGRTTLLLTLFAVLAATAMVRGHRSRAALWTFAALMSKEEAVALPAILFLWIAIRERVSSPHGNGLAALRTAARQTSPLFVGLAVYAVLRANTGAFMPWNAPSYYQFTFALSAIVRNLIEYADRSSTLAALVVSIVVIAAPGARGLTPIERSWLLLGGIWLAGGFAITLFLPVRSSLYACWPSVGSSLIGAVIACATARSLSAPARRRVLVAALVLPFVLLPLYWSRNLRLKREALLSTDVLTEITRASPDLREGERVIVYDLSKTRPKVEHAFGTLLPEAVLLTTGKRMNVSLRSSRRAVGTSGADTSVPQSGLVFIRDESGFHRLR